MMAVSGWKHQHIGSGLKLLCGFPFESSLFSNEDGFPLIRIRDVVDSQIATYYQGPILSTYIIKQGDVLVAMDGDFHVVRWKNQEALLNQRVLKVEVSADSQLDLDFIFYWLQPYIKKVNEVTAATTVKHLSTKDLLKAYGKLPSLRVQQKIARILQTVDQAIKKTEQLIGKYQQIKSGLMHDLFTRGIGADGQLRPPREQAPELYQHTPIGWIPKEWELTTCEEVCEKVIDCKNRTPPITPDGFPVIRTPNVRDGQFVDLELVYTDLESYKIWTARGKPVPGDIVITREAPVGEVCKIPDRHPEACLGQRMMLYRPDIKKIDSDFFLYALQSVPIQNRLDLISGGSTVGHVRVGDIRSLWIFKPENRLEQEIIAGLLISATQHLDRDRVTLDKLLKQKSGLMHDLLTGTVPVSVDSASEVSA